MDQTTMWVTVGQSGAIWSHSSLCGWGWKAVTPRNQVVYKLRNRGRLESQGSWLSLTVWDPKGNRRVCNGMSLNLTSSLKSTPTPEEVTYHTWLIFHDLIWIQSFRGSFWMQNITHWRTPSPGWLTSKTVSTFTDSKMNGRSRCGGARL